jgi:triphosphatase
MTEFELKFQVPADRAAAVEAAVTRGEPRRTHLRARYFDTAGEALAAAEISLRLRQEDRRWVQTAKARGAGGFERLEHEVEVRGGADTLPDPSLHDAHPVGEVLRSALAKSPDATLACVFETDITRLARIVESGSTRVEIALDRGQLLAGGRHAPVLEIEFELKQGDAAAAVELAQRWCEEHGLWLDPLSKAAAGRRLAKGEQAPAAVHAGPVARSDSAPALAASMLDSALEQVLANARELAAGLGGDEHVHQLRVGLRRLRTVLRDLHAIVPMPPLEPSVQESLEALFSRLGEHRDRATLLPSLQDEMAAAGNPAAPWHPALPDLPAILCGAETQAALLRVLALARQLRDAPPQGLKPARKAVRGRLAKLHRRTLRAALQFEALSPPERHTVRKRLKRLRYLSELSQPLFRRGAVKDYVQALKTLQDALGLYQDAAAGRALFAQRAKEDPAAWFAVGWLAAREEQLAAECARTAREMRRDAHPFWD